MKKSKELIFYVTVCMGTALSSSSFTVMAGMFETINGIWVIISTILAGLFCIVIADSISELASRYPSAPGIRTYLKNAFSQRNSLFFAYLYMLFILVIGSVESCMFSMVVKELFPSVNVAVVLTLMLVCVISFNLIGLEMPRNIQIVTTVVIAAALLALGLAGFYQGQDNIGAMFNGVKDMSQLKWLPVTFGMAIFLYVGFECVTPLGFSSQSYKKLIPRSMPLAIVLNVMVYVVFIAGMCLVVSKQQLSANIFPHVSFAVALLGKAGVWFAVILSALAIISTFNSGIMSGSRLVYALAREGKMPAFLTRISMTSGVPYFAIIMLGILVEILSLLVNTFDLVLVSAAVGSSIICFIYASLMTSGMIIHAKNGVKPGGYQAVFSRQLKRPLVAVLCFIGLLSIFSIPGKHVSFLILFVTVTVVAYIMSLVYGRTKVAPKKYPAMAAAATV